MLSCSMKQDIINMQGQFTQMQKVEFRVLCADDGHSCTTVKKIMEDFEITQADKTDDFDHKGVKTFQSLAEAKQRIDEIKSQAGEHLIDVTMRVMR